MLGHSRSRPRQNPLSKSQVLSSPSRRRVTRSQSRELEDTTLVEPEIISTTGKHDSRSKWRQSKALAPVVEESPIRSPLRSTTRRDNAVNHGTPEDAANISGTTILPELEPSDHQSNPDGETMLKALPALELAARDVLNILTPRSLDPRKIVQLARKLRDPKNTGGRNLRRSLNTLSIQLECFGNQTYIDVDTTRRMISSALPGGSRHFQDWSPGPILHMANCARFAAEILLAERADRQRQTIKNIENLFPLPFMTGLVQDGQRGNSGESALGNDTLKLALEIRAQSVKMLLEEVQHDPDFDFDNTILLCFRKGSSSKSPLRGFNLPDFGGVNGSLPEKYSGMAEHRFREISCLSIDEVMSFLPWSSFAYWAADWIPKRIEEIRTMLKKQMSAQDVRDAYFDFSSKPSSFASAVSGSSIRELEQSAQDATAQDVVEEETGEPPEQQQQRQQRPEREPEAELRTAQRDTEHRRTSKGSFLNPASLQRLRQRQERHRSRAEASNSRRSDIVRSVSQLVSEQSAAHRRQTISAIPSGRSTAQDEPRVDPTPSAIGNPTFQFDIAEDITTGEDLHLDFGPENTQIERSHSPPVGHRSTTSAREEFPSTSRQTLSQRIWESTKTGPTTQASPEASRRARFIDRQSQAQQVSPISLSDPQSAPRRVEERVSRKRARSRHDSETPDEDDLFDYDTRSLNIERRRAAKPSQPQSKRRRIEEARETRDSTGIGTDGETNDDVDESSRRISWQNRSAVASSKSTASADLLSSRRRWTTPEDRRLERLLQEHGPSWAIIERQNQAQPAKPGEERIERAGNVQVQLKDRARNLKILYIRNGKPMHRCFKGVTMKKADIERLEQGGHGPPLYKD
ncbi:hypothetical protein BJX61DRAFT_346609 [Aspergillus egyptiacus]|nr:hypothetical protein BJX61DRAFT_346609 [Aspergillus egyptiacus]